MRSASLSVCIGVLACWQTKPVQSPATVGAPLPPPLGDRLDEVARRLLTLGTNWEVGHQAPEVGSVRRTGTTWAPLTGCASAVGQPERQEIDASEHVTLDATGKATLFGIEISGTVGHSVDVSLKGSVSKTRANLVHVGEFDLGDVAGERQGDSDVEAALAKITCAEQVCRGNEVVAERIVANDLTLTASDRAGGTLSVTGGAAAEAEVSGEGTSHRSRSLKGVPLAWKIEDMTLAGCPEKYAFGTGRVLDIQASSFPLQLVSRGNDARSYVVRVGVIGRNRARNDCSGPNRQWDIDVGGTFDGTGIKMAGRRMCPVDMFYVREQLPGGGSPNPPREVLLKRGSGNIDLEVLKVFVTLRSR